MPIVIRIGDGKLKKYIRIVWGLKRMTIKKKSEAGMEIPIEMYFGRDVTNCNRTIEASASMFHGEKVWLKRDGRGEFVLVIEGCKTNRKTK